MEHMKPTWFVRVLSWIDFVIEFALGVTIFILAALMITTVIGLSGVEEFLFALLFGGTP